MLGEPYASFSFDGSAEGWTTGGLPTWLRSQPGTKTGTDDPSTQSFGIEGPGQYVDNMDATLTSPLIPAAAGPAVVEFWLKADVEDGFDSPGGDVFVRFRFTSDMLCSGTGAACGTLDAGARVDEVVVGKQAA